MIKLSPVTQEVAALLHGLSVFRKTLVGAVATNYWCIYMYPVHFLGVDYSISIYSIVYFEVLIFIMPIFVFKIQLVCSKWVLSVGLLYLSRLFEKGFRSKVNKR